MKRVKDYLKFDEFEKTLSEKLYPKIQEIVKSALDPNKPKIDKIKKYKTYFIISILLNIALFIFLFIVIFYLSKNSIIFAVIVFILVLANFAINLFFIRFISRTKAEIKRDIDKRIDENYIYKVALEAIPTVSLKEVHNKRFLSTHEIQEFSPVGIPDHARLFSANPTVSVYLFDKFETSLTSLGFEWYVTSGKQRVRYESWGFYMKIDTKALENQNFNFSFFTTGKYFSGASKANLENKTFNKAFLPLTDDQIKIRMLLTPLAMETMLNRLSDAKDNEVSLRNFTIVSRNGAIYYGMQVSPDFMVINFETKSFDLEEIVKSIYSDIVYDIYGLYYLLSFVIIPSYLD